MFLYRIGKAVARTTDLSGTGAYRVGGRWNSKGTYMLYTSENSSLAYLETLVHFNEAEYPPHLHIMKIEIDDKSPVYTLKEAEYPDGWMQLELLENKALGDRLMKEKNVLAVKVRSAINTLEYNYLLNPLFPRFFDLVKVADVREVKFDER
ncbi:MAG TPA: RES family NAD+ phosphorylase, partial [Flavisolibacter sp.]|nr:RES family NAD+ phosphorylase [Flavisolibacter sp.]